MSEDYRHVPNAAKLSIRASLPVQTPEPVSRAGLVKAFDATLGNQLSQAKSTLLGCLAEQLNPHAMMVRNLRPAVLAANHLAVGELLSVARLAAAPAGNGVVVLLIRETELILAWRLAHHRHSRSGRIRRCLSSYHVCAGESAGWISAVS